MYGRAMGCGASRSLIFGLLARVAAADGVPRREQV